MERQKHDTLKRHNNKPRHLVNQKRHRKDIQHSAKTCRLPKLDQFNTKKMEKVTQK